MSWPLIGAEMTAWVEEVNQLTPGSLDFPEQLAALHCRFEQIHPFLDGNGRAGRLLLDLALVRLGYPPAVIYERDRGRYLRALRRADAGRPAMLGAMLARAVLNGLHRYAAPAADEEDRLAPLAALASPDLKLPALRASSRPRPAGGCPRPRRPVAQLPEAGRRVPGRPLAAVLSPTADGQISAAAPEK